MRHCALRIVFGYLLEFFLGFLVPERMQQCEAPFKRFLHGWRTRYWEMYCAQLICGQIFVMMAFVGSRRK